MKKSNDIFSRFILMILIIVLFVGCFSLLSSPAYSKYVSSKILDQVINSNDPEKPWEYTKLDYTDSSFKRYEVGYGKVLSAGKYYFTEGETNYYFTVDKNMAEGSSLTLNPETGKISSICVPDMTGYTYIGMMSGGSDVKSLSLSLNTIVSGGKYYCRFGDDYYTFVSDFSSAKGGTVYLNTSNGMFLGSSITKYVQTNSAFSKNTNYVIATKFTDGNWYALYCDVACNATSYWYISPAMPLADVVEDAYLFYGSDGTFYTKLSLSSTPESNYLMIAAGSSSAYIYTNKNGNNSTSGALGRRNKVQYAQFGASMWDGTLQTGGPSCKWTYNASTKRLINDDGDYLYLNNIDSTSKNANRTNNSYPWQINSTGGDIYAFESRTVYPGVETVKKSIEYKDLDTFTRYPQIEK
ncbi:MAG: hypothetical protein PUD72_05480 [Oscillospiraceae bacterium]|nr:hypothetical protein [Oscillospiraceae bacterium]